MDKDAACLAMMQIDHGPIHGHFVAHIVEKGLQGLGEVVLLGQSSAHGEEQGHNSAPAHSSVAFLCSRVVVFENTRITFFAGSVVVRDIEITNIPF